MQSEGKMRNRNRWLIVISIVVFLTGLAVLLYPAYTDRLYRKEVQQQRTAFEEQIEAAFERQIEAAKERAPEEPLPALPFEDLYQELKRRNDTLFAEKLKDLKDPFSYQQPAVALSEFGLEGNIIGFISIPKMEIELPILLGANTENMREGAVHLTETSYPIGGVNTNCVLAAHRGSSRAAMFRDIEALEIGDEIYIRNFRETLTYQVAELRVISPTDVQELLIQNGRDLVTLITCHPYRHNYQRYVVFCERVQP